MFSNKIINNKKVIIFEKHSSAIIPWAELSNSINVIPCLITLDHHTDTRDAFLRYAYYESNKNTEKAKTLRSQLVQKIDKYNTQSLLDAEERLHHDEHIDAAIKSLIINHSFSIQYSERSGTLSIEEESYQKNYRDNYFSRNRGELIAPEPPFNYKLPENKMFIIPNICSVDCPRGPHTEECLVEHANQAIEDIFLNDKLNFIRNMSYSSGLGDFKQWQYILDIDLDYFHTFKSINPNAKNIFHSLIKNSLGVTIARESGCVDDLKIDKEINSNYLEQEILKHIEIATQ